MIRTGKVVAVHDGQIEVEFSRPEACAKCGMCAEGHAQCHQITLPGQAQVGDEVDVEMEDKRIPIASMWAYVLPLFTLCIGLALAAPLTHWFALDVNADLFAALCGLIGVAVGFVILRLCDPMFRTNKWQPKIVDVRHPDEE